MAGQQVGRWKRRPEERPSQILDAALDVFESRGLSGARLEEIAEEAGISKGTIYLYFENKEALFRAVVERTIVEAAEEFAERERTGTATERLHHLAAEFWGHFRTQAFQTVYRLVLGELHKFPELAQSYLDQVPTGASGTLASLIEDGMATGEFGSVAPLPTARMILGLLLTHAAWCERRTLFPQLAQRTDDEVFAEVMEFCQRSLSNRPGPNRRSHVARS
jgi:AcrR family transcriptional regulator